MEHRKHIRAIIPIKIKLRDSDTDGVFINFHLKDLSAGGIFITSDLLWEPGDIMELTFSIPDDPGEICAKGEVVRVEDKFNISEEKNIEDGHEHGMAIKFIEIEKKDIEKIREFISFFANLHPSEIL